MQKGSLCEDRGRDWSDVATREEMQGAARNWRRQEEFGPRSLRRSVALLTLRFRTRVLQNSEKRSFCCVKPVCGTLLWQPCKRMLSVQVGPSGSWFPHRLQARFGIYQPLSMR